MWIVGLVFTFLDAKVLNSGDTLVPHLSYLLVVPIVGPIGLLIAIRRPQNPIGWLLLSIAAVDAIFAVADGIAIRGLLNGASPRGWVAWPSEVANVTQGSGEILLFFVVFFFPNGHLLPGPRWLWATRVMFALAPIATVSNMIVTAPIPLLVTNANGYNVPNPLAVPALDGLTNNNGAFSTLSFLYALLLLVVTVVVRFRRSKGVERKQLRWFTYTAGVMFAISILTLPFGNGPLSVLGGVVFLVGLPVILPAMIGLAVIKYGLYDIDVFVNRSIVYGSLAVFITAVYVGIAVGIGALIGSGGKPNLALSILATAIVAVGFQPFRQRVQRIANRMVYGERATPYEVLSTFSSHIADTYAAEDLLARMAQVLQQGTGAESAVVWLRRGDQLTSAAIYPDSPERPSNRTLESGALPKMEDMTMVIPVEHHGELLGALSIVKRRGENLAPLEEKLIADLAHQAGLVLKNVRLADDLRARLRDLQESSQRLVKAQDEERRRLERNLHDGAQQNLVALKVKLGLAEMLLGRDPEKATATLDQLKSDADEALETVRDLARGIYPPLLAEKGLVIALESQAQKATVPVVVEGDGVTRYGQDIEAAVYFCVLEALQNAQKYARASKVVVSLKDRDGLLDFVVTDDGAGFDRETVKQGAGLTNMRDRLDALGGDVGIHSQPGQGTRLVGFIPTALEAVA